MVLRQGTAAEIQTDLVYAVGVDDTEVITLLLRLGRRLVPVISSVPWRCDYPCARPLRDRSLRQGTGADTVPAVAQLNPKTQRLEGQASEERAVPSLTVAISFYFKKYTAKRGH